MTDLDLPILKYESDDPFQNGLAHGKAFKEAINELIVIRKSLLIKRSPHLEQRLDEFARLQFNETQRFDQNLSRELEGIAQGSESAIEDIIILNNYTDFRDIQLKDEGCTSLSFIDDKESIAAQTWDMHQSAKNYLMIIETNSNGIRSLIYTVCGCLGLMAVNNYGQFIGVNNINVVDGENGIIWPALIRKVSQQKSQDEIVPLLLNTKITSGHNYLISDGEKAFNYEVTPTLKKVLAPQTPNLIFHTNHCVDKDVQKVEDQNNISNTTHARYNLMEKYTPSIKDERSVINVLMSHDGMPLSICSHYAPKGAGDPSQTCGGAVYNFKTQLFKAWRGCKEHDKNFREVEISLPLS